jgi:hypothetical protein
MIHGQLIGWEGAAAPVTATQGETVLPPAAPAQVPGLVPFPFDILLVDFDDEVVQGEPPK